MKSMDEIINDAEIQAAKLAGQKSLNKEHRAISVAYDSNNRKLHIVSTLDADFGVHHLFCGVYGSKDWMQKLMIRSA